MPQLQTYPDRFITLAHRHRITKTTTVPLGKGMAQIDDAIEEYNSFNRTKPLVIPPGKNAQVSLALYRQNGRREIEIESHSLPY